MQRERTLERVLDGPAFACGPEVVAAKRLPLRTRAVSRAKVEPGLRACGLGLGPGVGSVDREVHAPLEDVVVPGIGRVELNPPPRDLGIQEQAGGFRCGGTGVRTTTGCLGEVGIERRIVRGAQPLLSGEARGLRRLSRDGDRA